MGGRPLGTNSAASADTIVTKISAFIKDSDALTLQFCIPLIPFGFKIYIFAYLAMHFGEITIIILGNLNNSFVQIV